MFSCGLPTTGTCSIICSGGTIPWVTGEFSAFLFNRVGSTENVLFVYIVERLSAFSNFPESYSKPRIEYEPSSDSCLDNKVKSFSWKFPQTPDPFNTYKYPGCNFSVFFDLSDPFLIPFKIPLDKK